MGAGCGQRRMNLAALFQFNIAFGDRSAADLAVDRCVDLGVADVDLGRLQRAWAPVIWAARLGG
jgi:hypothetical protein